MEGVMALLLQVALGLFPFLILDVFSIFLFLEVKYDMYSSKMVPKLHITMHTWLEMKWMLRFYSKLWACCLMRISTYPHNRVTSPVPFFIPFSSICFCIIWSRYWFRQLLAVERLLIFG